MTIKLNRPRLMMVAALHHRASTFADDLRTKGYTVVLRKSQYTRKPIPAYDVVATHVPYDSELTR